MKATEELESVGDYTVGTGVESVVGEEGAKVVAANGVISVVAANDVNVAVYSIDGSVVALGNVKAGETYEVAANNGLYIVKVGKTSCKVML